MRTILIVVGTVAVLTGTVWVLQGFNVLGGSFMSGRRFWAEAGIVTLGIGVGFIYLAIRMANSKRKTP